VTSTEDDKPVSDYSSYGPYDWHGRIDRPLNSGEIPVARRADGWTKKRLAGNVLTLEQYREKYGTTPVQDDDDETTEENTE
jgi:hypothetical protein